MIAGLELPVDQWTVDADHFYFEIPTGTEIQSITLSWTTDLVPGTTFFAGGVTFSAAVRDSNDYALVFKTVTYDLLDHGNTLPFLGDLSPDPADLFALTMLSTGSVQSLDHLHGGGVVSYQWTVNVGEPASVAEPAGAMMALGLLVIWLLSRAQA